MAESSFYVEIVTSENVKFKGDVEYLRLPGSGGEMGILKNHAPLIALLQPGEGQIRQDGKDIFIALSDGLVKITENKVLVVVSYAFFPDEIDVEEQERVVKDEDCYLKGTTGLEPESAMHKLRLLRARVNLKVARERTAEKTAVQRE